MGETSSAPSQNEASILSTDPAHLAFLMGQIARKETVSPRGHYPAPKIRPQRKPHNFTPAQRLSYEFIKSWASELPEGFTLSELKKAFRQAAIAVHPDHGGSVTLFLELKDHHEVLKNLVAP